NFLWTQDKKNIFVKIDLADVVNKYLKVQLTREALSFSATSRGKQYQLEIKFRFRVNPKTAHKKKTWNACPLIGQKRDKKKKTLCKIDWKSSSTNMTATKKELDTNNNEDWKYMKPRPALNEWDELSEYDDIYVFPDKKKEANVTSNEGNNEQEASAATTENEKSQPWQINEKQIISFSK
ncbi:hypothetical protein RFI_35618, partial [Reticulomyxa filosa]